MESESVNKSYIARYIFEDGESINIMGRGLNEQEFNSLEAVHGKTQRQTIVCIRYSEVINE